MTLDLTPKDAVDVVVLALEYAQKVEAGTATADDVSTLVCHLTTLDEDLPGLLGVEPSTFHRACPKGGEHEPLAAGDANDGGPVFCRKCQYPVRYR